MLSTGDVQGYLRKLEALLRVIKYPGYIDYNGLSKGDPSAFLPILSFTLTSFSPPFAEQLMAAGLELTGKTDLRFTETVYKVLRDIFQYKPMLTKQQFLQWGFSQRKISVICDIINLVLQKHSQLKKVSKKSFVIHHMENPMTSPTNSSHTEPFSLYNGTCASREVYSPDSSSNDAAELPGKEDKDNSLHDVGEVVTISRESWENLISRVLLLETKFEQRNTQEDCKRATDGIQSVANFGKTKKREDYLEWPEYFMAVAFLSAQRSKDPNSQVGACIVNQENKIVGIGYNGMPNGCNDDLLPWSRSADDQLDTKYPYVCHAELNAIMNKNSADVKDCTMYVALFPCNECAKLIIQAGLKEVVYLSDKYHDTPEMTASRRLLSMAKIKYRKLIIQTRLGEACESQGTFQEYLLDPSYDAQCGLKRSQDMSEAVQAQED
ncbi:uncharacterized protein LOC116327593 isoform X2 [Oreochromis aureus]|uniref:uncharacterized protein LOC116327593 isoform X2 n=1 Tax=Oreochromis aureus TaxID=47969 RepID=UPI0012BC06DF|nr:uncharacterized protein LOC116327593 isoform X2 [Oreochromis aureus]